jgi:hypothetical protein
MSVEKVVHVRDVSWLEVVFVGVVCLSELHV